MEAQSRVVYRKAKARPAARVGRHWGSGIFARELRAAWPAILALAGIMALFAAIGVFGEYLLEHYRQGSWGLYRSKGIRGVWSFMGLLVYLMVGVLCGAEEAENGTADFTRRLPVSRARLYWAKTGGALCAVALWFVLANILVNLIIYYGLRGLTSLEPAGHMIEPTKDSARLLFTGLLLFFSGQAAGAWTERVIVGAVAGGGLALAGIYFSALVYGHVTGAEPAFKPLFFVLYGMLILTALGAAFLRFVTREGR